MVRDLRNRRRFESLENRLMLASDAVAAAVIGGNLTIVGDGKADAFLVSGDGMSDGKVTITGYTGSDGNQTLIDGKASVNIAGVTSITVLLGNGNVTVSVADLDVAKNLTITGGSGNETIDIGKLAPLTTPSPSLLLSDAVSIGNNLSITGGNGNNTVNEESLFVANDEFIVLGTGNNSITIGCPVSPSVKPGVTAGASSELIGDGGVTFGYDLWVETGSDDAPVSSVDLQAFDAVLDILLGQGLGPPPRRVLRPAPMLNSPRMLPHSPRMLPLVRQAPTPSCSTT